MPELPKHEAQGAVQQEESFRGDRCVYNLKLSESFLSESRITVWPTCPFDLPFDTLKAQLLAQISAKSNLTMITYDDYNIEWIVPRIVHAPDEVCTTLLILFSSNIL